MDVVVLGSAAGGGVPQWNCGGEPCRRARTVDPLCPPRTQAGIAVSANARDWILIGASPDLPEQIRATTALHPSAGETGASPIAAVVLTGSDVDAVAGLLSLRERQPFELPATAKVHASLGANPIFEVLAREVVRRRAVRLGDRIELAGGLEIEIDFGGCRCQAFALTSDAGATDPVCELSPDHALVAAARHASEANQGAALRRGYAAALLGP